MFPYGDKMKKILTLEDVVHTRRTYQRFYQDRVGGSFVPPVSMVNNGYLHNLNASFDGILLRESDAISLLEPQQPVNFGTMQPCVRNEDQRSQRSSPLHLSLFEIFGYSRLDFEQMTPQEMAVKTIDEFVKFYTSYLGLDPALLRVYYFGGGTLRQASNGKIKNDQYIEPDAFSRQIWASHDIENLVAEHSNETFLLHLGEPVRKHHAGYRNDIFMRVGNIYFEIATLNFISHQTLIEKGEITGIAPLPFYLREMAAGQERILAAMRGSNDLYELPFIAPLVKAVNRKLQNEEMAKIVADALRVVHYVISDGWTYDRLQGQEHERHRHELNGYVRILSEHSSAIGRDDFVPLLQKNAELQPWHPKLASNIEQVVVTVIEYSKRKQKKKR